jgi:hypothetical protein
MKTLAQLRAEAEQQEKPLDNPRMFLALFPVGPRNGKFVDPFLGLIQLKDSDKVIYVGLEGHKIQADWVE